MSVPTTGPPNVPQMTPSMLGSMLHAAGSGVGGVPPDPPTYAASQQPSVYGGGGTGGHRGGAGVPGVDPTTQLYSSYATPPPPPPSYMASRYMASMGGGQGAGGTGVTTGVPGRYPAATSSYMNSYSTLQPQHMQLVHHQQHTVIARPYKLKHVCITRPFIEGALKRAKQRALHVHQTKTKHFIAKLFAQPIESEVIFSICMHGFALT